MDPSESSPEDDNEHDSRRPAVIGLIVVAVLVVVAYFLVTALRRNSQMEDCLMSGRTNCAPIEAPSGGR
jgi:hypothetical protein